MVFIGFLLFSLLLIFLPDDIASKCLGCFILCVVTIIHNKYYKKQKNKINSIINEHIKTLARKKKTLYTQDDYGNVDISQYENELVYFTRKVLFKEKDPTPQQIKKWAEYTDERVNEYLKKEKKQFSKTIPEIDDTHMMTPQQYEDYCANILKQLGWKARTTRRSGDQGVDVIATKNDTTIVLQCKFYSHPVSNKAVQEVIAGKEFFKADYAGVVTNNRYTQSAKELARQSDVLLLNTRDLIDLDERIF